MPAAETVTILFTDLVGSTELTTRLGDEAADVLRRQHFAGLHDAVAATGGEVVKNLGDGLMVAYRGAADAVDGAVLMQQSMGRLRAPGGIEVAMKVGVSAGDATNEDGDWFGTPVIEAARLCAAAGGGQILVSDLVRMLAGSRTPHELASVGALELKGLPAPLPTSEVRWTAGSAAGRAPLPGWLGVAGPLVGRTEELAVLVDAWRDAQRHGTRVVLVSGDAGIGKTRLVGELAARAHREGGLVLAGRCTEGLKLPYLPWLEGVESLLATFEVAQVLEWLGPAAAEVGRFFPQLGGGGRGATTTSRAGADRWALFEAVTHALAGAAGQLPVLGVFDDLQWADQGTLQLLRHVVAQADDEPALIVGTFRDAEVPAGHPLHDLLADWRRDRRVARLPLAGLPPDDVAALVEAATGGRPRPALAEALRAETDGNPFFVEEVGAHLLESGAARPVDGWLVAPDGGEVDLAAIGVPDGVREVVGRRLARLPEVSQPVLAAAAVVGRDFDLDVLADVAEVDEDALLDVLEEAVIAGLLAEDRRTPGRFTFVHAVVRAVLVDRLSLTRRTKLHERAAAALARVRPGDVMTPAGHLVEAAAGAASEPAAALGLAAAEQALTALAFEDAIDTARAALAVAPEDDLRLRLGLLLVVADAAGILGRTAPCHDAAVAATDLARRLGDDAAFVRAVDAYGLTGGLMVVDDQLAALTEEALQRLPAGDSVERVRLRSNQAAWLHVGDPFGWDPDTMDEVLGMADRLGDPDAVYYASTLAAVTLIGWGRAQERLALTERALAAESDATVWCSSNPRLWRATALLSLGDRAGFTAAIDDLDAWARDHGHAVMAIGAAVGRAVLGCLDGRFDDAIAGLEAALGESSDPLAIVSRLSFQMYVNAERGRHDLALPMIEVLAGMPAVPGARADLAAIYAHQGRTDEAAALVDEFASSGYGLLPRNWGRPASLKSLVEAVAVLGDQARAAELLPLLEPYDGLLLVSYAGQVCRGAAASAAGQLLVTLGRWDDAVAALADATALEARVGGRSLLPRTTYWCARALLGRGGPGDPEQGRRMAAEAAREAATLGMDELATEAAALAAERS